MKWNWKDLEDQNHLVVSAIFGEEKMHLKQSWLAFKHKKPSYFLLNSQGCRSTGWVKKGNNRNLIIQISSFNTLQNL